MSAPPIDPLNAMTSDVLRDRKEFKKLLMDQVRASGGTNAVERKGVFQGLVKDTGVMTLMGTPAIVRSSMLLTG